MKGDWTDILVTGGAIIVSVGLGMVYLPAGVIAIGAGLMTLGILTGTQRDDGDNNQGTNP